MNPSDLAICDTLQHLRDLSKFKLPWLNGDSVELLRHSFLMSDYLKLPGPHKVTKTVYMEVNTGPSQQTAEAEYVLDLCGKKENLCAARLSAGRRSRPNSQST